MRRHPSKIPRRGALRCAQEREVTLDGRHRTTWRLAAFAAGIFVIAATPPAAAARAELSCDLDGDGLCTQPELSARAAALSPRGVPGGASTTIDLTLSVARRLDPDQVTFTVGLASADDGAPLPISGYTLDFSFDDAELAFADAAQLVPFPIGTIGFTPPNNCTAGRCTAGNILGVASDPVGPLFSITFDVIAVEDDGIDDFTAGILDPVFDDVSQPVGEPVFAKGIEIVSHTVPEPSGTHVTAAAIAAVAAWAARLPRGRILRLDDEH